MKNDLCNSISTDRTQFMPACICVTAQINALHTEARGSHRALLHSQTPRRPDGRESNIDTSLLIGSLSDLPEQIARVLTA